MIKNNKAVNISNLEKIMNNIAGYIFWKDQNSVYLGCNDAFAKVAGGKTQWDIIGKTDYDLPWAEMTDVILHADQEAFEGKNELILEALPLAIGGKPPLLTNKHTLIGTDGKPIGIIGNALTLSSKFFIESAAILGQSESKFKSKKSKQQPIHYFIRSNYQDIHLSRRESECLFYLLRGKTAKQTSAILKISPKTVEYFILKVKIKLNVYTKTELIEKAIEMGLLNTLPLSLINKDLPESLK